jgi:hypothetical protein
LNVLDIRYKPKNLNIFVYNQSVIEDKFKARLIKYYKKVSNLNSIIQKFGIERSYLTVMLTSYNIKKVRKFLYYNVKKNILNFLLFLAYKRYLVIFLYTYIKITKVLGKKIKFSLYQIFSFKLNFFILNKKKLNFFFSQFILLRKINGFFKIALISKTLENVIYILTKKEIKLKINNIFLKKGFVRMPVFGKQLIKSEFRFKFFTVFLSFVYHNSKLIGDYLAKVIAKNKQHRKSLIIFSTFVEKIIFSKVLVLSGFQLRVTGKLGGKMRKSKYHYKLGIVKLQSLKYSLSYNCIPSYTKFGIISIKV